MPVRFPVPTAPGIDASGPRLVGEDVAARRPVARRPRWTVPLACSLLVMLSWLAAASPLSALGGVMPGARLRLSPAFVALAPLCDVLDTLTLLSIRQHVALLVTIYAVFALWRLHKRRSAAVRTVALGEVRNALVLLGGIAAFYSFGALAPRPMAGIALLGARNVAIDFHSHTNASWDGRRRFTAEDNREWHRAAGFDVSYVSDHATMAAVVAGMRGNPVRAGDGTVILPATEVRCGGQHIVILGATARDTAAECDPLRSPMTTHAATAAGDERVMLLTIPGNLAPNQRLPAVHGLEIADGAPRALDQMQRDERLLQHVADSGGLARMSGSNNHGWGRTAAAWSVMSIDGWRAMSPGALDLAIRRQLLHEPRTAVHVIERRRANPGASPLAIAATAPVVAWTMLTTLSTSERLAWLSWIWGVWSILALVHAARSRGRRDASTQAPRPETTR